ncbi:hypothetical protein [Eubacterium sp. 1001713B170207_170306_E7]|uniref:hypothetical protein n=1 Tax=Eubacterium sp. 1001713B170207_170306_E7 TaxID=2787097 RepID=UPI001A9B2DE9|nr:hypothetical protein [Eubacterium sp. 1001713B170207_170306_E7]
MAKQKSAAKAQKRCCFIVKPPFSNQCERFLLKLLYRTAAKDSILKKPSPVQERFKTDGI